MIKLSTPKDFQKGGSYFPIGKSTRTGKSTGKLLPSANPSGG